MITELGFPGAMQGWDAQADALREHLEVADEAGCTGTTVFSWTDEWGVNGVPVEGWGFGITTTGVRRSPRSPR